MKPFFKLVAVIAFFVGVTYVVPFDKAEEFLEASLIKTPSQAKTISLTEAEPVVEEEGVEEETVASFVDGMDEFILKSDEKGTENYVIPQNTCRNGVRIVVRSAMEVDNMSADLHLFGFSRRTSRETYNNVVTLTKKEPVRILHLPSELLYDSDTLFPEYQITRSRNSDYIRYDVLCY